jgi:hypothetical protein
MEPGIATRQPLHVTQCLTNFLIVVRRGNDGSGYAQRRHSKYHQYPVLLKMNSMANPRKETMFQFIKNARLATPMIRGQVQPVQLFYKYNLITSDLHLGNNAKPLQIHEYSA